MNNHFLNTICTSTGAQACHETQMIQELWSGYGKILRYELEGAELESVIVKHVQFDSPGKRHRKGSGDLSHERKLKSYKVESAWYAQWSNRCDESCRIPHCYALERTGDEVLMVLEDLDSSGFSGRRRRVEWHEMVLGLEWLANFHATFMGATPENLWKTGTYWHLATRPQELKALSDGPLKKAAGKIDQRLSATPFKTFVHGDAKLANFCFTPTGDAVAAVDFQYVGGGCGMKDVAYFMSSCVDESECDQWVPDLLDSYFGALVRAVSERHSTIDTQALEENWRNLFPLAWTDFHRFYKGWSPYDRWHKNSYSERTAAQVIRSL